MIYQQESYLTNKLVYDAITAKAPLALLSVSLMTAGACKLQLQLTTLTYEATQLVKQLLTAFVKALLAALLSKEDTYPITCTLITRC